MKMNSRSKDNQHSSRHIQASPSKPTQIEKKYEGLLYNEEHEISEIQQFTNTHKI